MNSLPSIVHYTRGQELHAYYLAERNGTADESKARAVAKLTLRLAESRHHFLPVQWGLDYNMYNSVYYMKSLIVAFKFLGFKALAEGS